MSIAKQLNRARYDFVIVGGGILGMSTAWQLLTRHPGASLLLLEKEPGPARHQTGRNSGVIHAGVYYTPGSLKAKYCKIGNRATKTFCKEHSIPFEECGKLLVATSETELDRMQSLVDRCADNGIEIDVLDSAELHRREPAITGEGAIFVPSSGIVDYRQVCEKMAELIKAAGGEVRYSSKVTGLEESPEHVSVQSTVGTIEAGYLVTCTGIYSDRIATLLGLRPEFRIVPFRGEYFRLHERHNNIVNHLIYPIPDPDLPFLGVHLTRMIDGSVTVGPNAVLALGREAYRGIDIDLADAVEMFSFPGTFKVLARHFAAGALELKDSVFKSGYLRRVRKYCPSLQAGDLLQHPPGLRAQAVSRSGQLIDDFLFLNTNRCLLVCNAPSPAATSAIPIGEHILEKLEDLVAKQTARHDMLSA